MQPSRGFKSLSHETTFERDCSDFEQIRKTLLSLSEKVARRCRKHGLTASCVRLKWRFEDFSTFSRQRRMGESTDDARRIFSVALDLSRDFLPLTRAVRLIGVGVSGFESRDSTSQATLFGDLDTRKRSLDESVDRIAERFGSQAILKASLLDRNAEEEEFSSFVTN